MCLWYTDAPGGKSGKTCKSYILTESPGACDNSEVWANISFLSMHQVLGLSYVLFSDPEI